MATRYWVGGSGVWDGTDTTHWSATSGGTGGASIPTSADDVVFDANSGGGVCNFDTYGVQFCKSLMATNSNVQADHNYNWRVIDTHGSVAINSTWGIGRVGFAFNVTGTLTCNGGTLGACDFSAGTITLQDACNFGDRFVIQGGTFNSNNQSVTAVWFYMASGSVTWGSSTVTITGNGGIYHLYTYEVVGGTVTSPVSTTVRFTNTSASQEATFRDTTSPNYGAIRFDGSGGLYRIVSPTNVFMAFYCVAPCTIKFAPSSTTTVGTFNVNGVDAAALCTLKSETNGSTWTLSKSSGTVNCQFLRLQDSVVTGGATFNATQSYDDGNNSGWLITAPHAPAGNRVIRLTYLRR